MRENIWKLYVVQALPEAMFLIPVAVPFFRENGLSLQEIFVLQGIFAAVILILEVPTGYIADAWGRRNALLLSASFGVLGVVVYATGFTFEQFVVSEILLAVCFSLRSGTMDAMLFESLAALGRESEYRKRAGEMRFSGSIMQASASIAGGFIAIVALRLTLWATAVSYAVYCIFVLLLREPPRKTSTDGSHWARIVRITKEALGRNSAIRDIAMLYAVLATLTLSLVWFTQAYGVEVKAPLWLFGAVHAITMVASGFAAKSAHKLQSLMDDRVLLLCVAGIVAGSYLALGFVASLWGLALFVLGRAMYGLVGVIITDMVNRLTTSDVRATVLSIQALGYRALFVLLSPILGFLGDTRGVHSALLFAGIGGSIAIVAVFLAMRRVWARIPT